MSGVAKVSLSFVYEDGSTEAAHPVKSVLTLTSPESLGEVRTWGAPPEGVVRIVSDAGEVFEPTDDPTVWVNKSIQPGSSSQLRQGSMERRTA